MNGLLVRSVVEGVPPANSFRVVDDDDQHCFLDFLAYDPVNNIATVVSRIRVSRGFLPLMLKRLDMAFQDILK